MHILLWLHPNYKCSSPEDINKIISVKLLDTFLYPIAYQVVAEFTVYGPCGFAHLNFPYMVKGYCSKYNPKNFQIRTIVNEDEFPICRRRDMPHNITIKNNIQLDNRYVVPHNIDLIVKY